MASTGAPARVGGAGAAVDGASANSPLCNTGGKYPEGLPTRGGNPVTIARATFDHEFAPVESRERLVLSGKNVLLEPFRAPNVGQLARVDTVHWTVHEDLLHRYGTHITDDGVIWQLSRDLESIFGFPVTAQRKSGVHGYRDSYTVGNAFGLVGIGGCSGTVYVQISGYGCLVAADGWESRLAAYLDGGRGYSAKITRIDICIDELVPDAYDIRSLHASLASGVLRTSVRGRPAKIECRGDWDNESYTGGRTIYYGSRDSGLLLRIYEKGRQLGDPESPWIRFELEFLSSGYVLSPDMLLDPTGFIFGRYPWLQTLFPDSNHSQSQAEAAALQGMMSLEKCLSVLKTQYGRHIACLLKFFTPEELVERIKRDDGVWPDRLEKFDHLSRRALGERLAIQSMFEDDRPALRGRAESHFSESALFHEE